MKMKDLKELKKKVKEATAVKIESWKRRWSAAISSPTASSTSTTRRSTACACCPVAASRPMA